ncbi:MAG: undecaprenyl-diphosphate phosphatase [Bdellovibrionaceae bacterium]|nr:undecaprenyl-diphosphate phosphatase [Pseudobdellovibrionaceae bacterium]
MTFIHVLILSFIEGLTEFIPVSSTGHLILASALLQIESTDFSKAFDVIIQFGAILAVIFLYRKKLKWDPKFYTLVFAAFLPTAILGFLFKNKIDALMESTYVVAWALIAGGVVLIVIDSLFRHRTTGELTVKSATAIGFAQSIAMIPGVSRSAATIIGGQVFGLSRERAAEFSFILAIPTLGAATVYKLWKIRHILDSSYTLDLLLGVVLSLIFSIFAIRFFISVVNRFGFKYFGYYRIVLGVAVLILHSQGVL